MMTLMKRVLLSSSVATEPFFHRTHLICSLLGIVGVKSVDDQDWSDGIVFVDHSHAQPDAVPLY